MYLLPFTSAVLLVSSVTSQIVEPCYETLETIQFRWSIENIQARKEERDQDINSPQFPIDGSSRTKWHLRIYPKGSKNDPSHVALYVCVDKYSRQRELVKYSLNILDKNFNSNGRYVVSYQSNPNYFPADGNIPCFGQTTFLPTAKMAQYITSSGDLDVFVQVERLRKRPECLSSTESDLGRGGITNPLFSAHHCTTGSDVYREISYTWNGKAEGNNFDIKSPVFTSSTDSDIQWVLKMDANANRVAIYLGKNTGGDVTVRYVVTIHPQVYGREPITKTIEKHTFLASDRTLFGWNDISTSEFTRYYVDSNKQFEIRIRLFYINDKENCNVLSSRSTKPSTEECKNDGEQVGSLRKQLDEEISKNKRLTNQVNSEKEKNRELSSEVATLKDKNLNLNNEVGSKSTKIEELRNELRFEMVKYEELEKRVTDYPVNTCKDVENQLATKEGRIRELEGLVTALQTNTTSGSEVEVELQTALKQIAQLEEELKEKTGKYEEED